LQIFFRAKYDDSEGEIHTLAFLPEFSHIADQNSLDNGATLDRLEVIGMRLFVSTRLQGRLYNAREKSTLATYRYTYLTVQCCVTGTLLYAILDSPSSGLEAFTLRSSMNTAEYDPPEPCLLGQQTFLGPQFACVMGQHILLLSKMTDPSLPKPEPVTPFNPPHLRKAAPPVAAKPTTSPTRRGRRPPVIDMVAWNLYLLHPTDVTQLNAEILTYVTKTVANNADDINESVYYLLILEAHFLLQDAIIAAKLRLVAMADIHDVARTLSVKLDLRKLSMLLRNSASMLGDYYFAHAHNYLKAAQCYSESNRTLADVSRIFMQQEDGRAALLEYYDRVLFDPSMLDCMGADTDLSNEILYYYVEFAPHRLSTVIIDSCLSSYSQKLALVLLDLAQQVRTLEEKSRRSNVQAFILSSSTSESVPPLELSEEQQHEIPPKDLFAKALLTLDMSEDETALSVLHEMRGEPIVEFCTANPSLLQNEQDEEDEQEMGEAAAAAAAAANDNVPSGLFDLKTALSDPAADRNRLVVALRVAAPMSLLEIATRLEPEVVSPAVLRMPDESLALEGTEMPSPDAVEREDEFLLMCYLEYKLEEPLQKMRVQRSVTRQEFVAMHVQDDVAEMAGKLAQLYLNKIIKTIPPEDSTDSILNTAQRPFEIEETVKRLDESRKGDNFFCKWLNSHHHAFTKRRLPCMDVMPPFANNSADESPAKTLLIQIASIDVNTEATTPRNAVASPYAHDALDQHDYTQFYTKKFENLLCSGLLGDTTSLVDQLEAAINALEGVESSIVRQHRYVLRTMLSLVLPLSRKYPHEKTLEPLLTMFPLLAEELGAMFCSNAQDWAAVVNSLVATLREYPNKSPQYLAVARTYESVLSRIATSFTPQQFLKCFLRMETLSSSFVLSNVLVKNNWVLHYVKALLKSCKMWRKKVYHNNNNITNINNNNKCI